MRKGSVLRLAGFLFGLGRAVEAGAQITSSIYGVVRDPQGQVLPGVTVSAESPALRLGLVTTVTTDRSRRGARAKTVQGRLSATSSAG